MARTTRRWVFWILTGTALVALATGCGDDTSPAQAVPALSRELDRVDAAIAAGRFDAARTALDDLVNETAQARVDGRLDAGQADAILQAAGNLSKQLPDGAGSQPSPSPTPSPSPNGTLGEPGGADEDDEENSDEHADEKSDEKSDEHAHEKSDEKSEDGHGKGPSSENGPDDGHGN